MTTQTIRKPRLALDTIPELTRYHDDGCDLHPACLTCPLPRCRYDEPEDGHNVLKQVRNEAVAQVFQREGLSAGELAQRFNLSKRTVHRILQAQRNEAISDQPSARLSGGLPS